MHLAEGDGGKVLRCVATDGHRLARIDADLPEGAADIAAGHQEDVVAVAEHVRGVVALGVALSQAQSPRPVRAACCAQRSSR